MLPINIWTHLASLKLNIKKLHHGIQAHLSWQIEGEKVEAVADIFILAPKITVDAPAAMKSEGICFLAGML